MFKKVMSAAVVAVTVSMTFFPATAAIYGRNRYYYTDATYQVEVGARGDCENFGVTTLYKIVTQCDVINP